MKLLATFKICLLASFFATYQEEISGQGLYPMYGGVPIVYDNHSDDDLGLLLTVLLLAAKNKNGQNCNCCNCCNCGSGTKSIPVPYPIPFPTNNPIINNPKSAYTNDDDESYERPSSSSKSKQNSYEKTTTNYTLSYVPVPVDSLPDVDYKN